MNETAHSRRTNQLSRIKKATKINQNTKDFTKKKKRRIAKNNASGEKHTARTVIVDIKAKVRSQVRGKALQLLPLSLA